MTGPDKGDRKERTLWPSRNDENNPSLSLFHLGTDEGG